LSCLGRSTTYCAAAGATRALAARAATASCRASHLEPIRAT